MSTTIFITIDTEEDSWDQWRRNENPVENVKRLTMLQEIFNRYRAIPTYLVNFPVVNDEESCRVIKGLYHNHGCEIGTHIHPWNTPPFLEDINARNSMICNLPEKLIYEKIGRLHCLIKNRLGLEPKCFRAGRWGFGPVVGKCIFELGYQIDTSITPFVDWTYENGPDFTEASPFPYRFNPVEILRKDPNGPLLEIPPTIGFLQKNFGRCARFRKWVLSSRLSRYHFLGFIDRLRLINFRWLSPELSSSLDMIRLARSFIAQGHRCLSMSFHSNSLLPGSNPFVRNDRELDVFLSNIALFLEFASENDFEFSPLSDAVDTKDDAR